MSAPYGLVLERHRDLQGRERHVWYRKGLFVLLVAIVVLGLSLAGATAVVGA